MCKVGAYNLTVWGVHANRGVGQRRAADSRVSAGRRPAKKLRVSQAEAENAIRQEWDEGKLQIRQGVLCRR